jgi:hypothetical protein
VLRGRPGEQVRTLAEQSDDALLARLSLAAGRHDGGRVAVLRAKPGREGPPVLVLDALACRPYLRLPNLFVPCGLRLRPAVRRDALRALLAADPDRITWLDPRPDGTFAVHTLPETAFRPLESFVAYARDHDPQPLRPAAAAHRFALPPFTVHELAPAPPRRPARPRREPAPAAPPPASGLAAPPPPPPPAEPALGWLSWLLQRFLPGTSPPSTQDSVLSTERPPAPADPVPDAAVAADERRRALEARFQQAEGVAADDRPGLWQELGAVYAAQHRPADAAVCWLNALWEQDAPAPDLARAWLHA